MAELIDGCLYIRKKLKSADQSYGWLRTRVTSFEDCKTKDGLIRPKMKLYIRAVAELNMS